MIPLCGVAFSAVLNFMSAQGCFMQGGGCVLQQGQWVPVSSAAGGMTQSQSVPKPSVDPK